MTGQTIISIALWGIAMIAAGVLFTRNANHRYPWGSGLALLATIALPILILLPHTAFLYVVVTPVILAVGIGWLLALVWVWERLPLNYRGELDTNTRGGRILIRVFQAVAVVIGIVVVAIGIG